MGPHTVGSRLTKYPEQKGPETESRGRGAGGCGEGGLRSGCSQALFLCGGMTVLRNEMVVTSARPVSAPAAAGSHAPGGGADGRWTAALRRVVAFWSATDHVRRGGPTRDNGAKNSCHCGTLNGSVFGVTPGPT